ncbi:hypothetical protein RHGRI_026517 [Rhododendron griersonianum]|uniref:Uncharacterized protein n=1 Tax=Rhododendron griersonianum TaxID=479676 RepID=A0AAV6IT56_9ERIC|nr:hypothetical protein RHGRI_026517 [Rhododendron griersonianum]
MDKQVGQLQTILEEKEQLVLRSKDREKELEDKKTEVSKIRMIDSMLESKQLELSRHLKDLSQRNDQVPPFSFYQDSLLKILALESESKDSTEKLQEEIQKRSEELEILQEEVDKHEQHRDSPEKQVGQLQTILEEKEQLCLDMFLLIKTGRSCHQAINDIRRKFEVEKPLRKKRLIKLFKKWKEIVTKSL